MKICNCYAEASRKDMLFLFEQHAVNSLGPELGKLRRVTDPSGKTVATDTCPVLRVSSSQT